MDTGFVGGLLVLNRGLEAIADGVGVGLFEATPVSLMDLASESAPGSGVGVGAVGVGESTGEIGATGVGVGWRDWESVGPGCRIDEKRNTPAASAAILISGNMPFFIQCPILTITFPLRRRGTSVNLDCESKFRLPFRCGGQD